MPTGIGEKHRPLERARTASVLQKLIYTGLENAGEHRVRLTRLVIEMARTKEKLKRDVIGNALSGADWPGPENVWDWGEALRDLGIPWISGLWLLWAVGRHQDAIGIVLHWIAAHTHEADLSEGNAIDTIWQAFVMSHWLIDSTAVDEEMDFAKRMVRAEGLSDESHDEIWKHVVKLNDVDDQNFAYTSFVQHELAKKPWIAINKRIDEFDVAFKSWFKAGRTYQEPNPLVPLGRTLLAIGSSDLELPDRETATLIVFEQWLTSLEHGGMAIHNRGFDKSLISLLPSTFDEIPRPLVTQADVHDSGRQMASDMESS
jgi:hypothetical protein